MKKAIFKIAVLMGLFALVLVPQIAGAQTSSGNLNPWTLGGNLDLPSGGLIETVVGLINFFLGLLGLIAVVLIIVGGFKYMMAQGDETKLKNAKGLLVSGLIGLVLVILAWVIATFVISVLINAVSAT